MNYLHEAFIQSIYATGNSDPNPPVGAVLTSRNDKIIGIGYTQSYGSHHAEVMAIEDAKKNHGVDSLIGSTLYVTLEPCNHYGKTPPCTTAIKENRIGKVVIASLDQTEKVNGFEELKSSGIQVELANVENFHEQLLWTIDGFHFAQKHKIPRVMLKWAQTKSGWLAPEFGASGAISNSLSREVVFRLRRLFHSVLVTPGTVYHDRPLLTPRYDRNYSIKINNNGFLSKMLRSFESNYSEKFRKYSKRFIMLPRQGQTWRESDLREYLNVQAVLPGNFYLITDDLCQEKIISSLGYTVFYIPDYDDFEEILKYTYSMGAINLMVEAGPVFCDTLIQKSLADFLFIFKSKNDLWQKGRGFNLSLLAAQNKENEISDQGYLKLYDMDIDSDELVVYQKIK
jgi:diaminohydroxyphosphoribosylaminopyrimidine deaminase/5-amino-6-(5-phosphoribosylamino)uracil reductase